MLTKEKLVIYDDYLTLPDDGNHYEILGGELFMAASPITEHQRISLKLTNKLFTYIEKKGLGEVFSAPFDVIMSMTDVVQPDILFVANDRSRIITKKNIVAARDFIVEILSEGTENIDRNIKKELYKNHKVKEYWIADPAKKQVEQYLLKNEKFEPQKTFSQADSIYSKTIKGFKVSLEAIFSS